MAINRSSSNLTSKTSTHFRIFPAICSIQMYRQQRNRLFLHSLCLTYILINHHHHQLLESFWETGVNADCRPIWPFTNTNDAPLSSSPISLSLSLIIFHSCDTQQGNRMFITQMGPGKKLIEHHRKFIGKRVCQIADRAVQLTRICCRRQIPKAPFGFN